jgi:hypothetical protein
MTSQRVGMPTGGDEDVTAIGRKCCERYDTFRTHRIRVGKDWWSKMDNCFLQNVGSMQNVRNLLQLSRAAYHLLRT